MKKLYRLSNLLCLTFVFVIPSLIGVLGAYLDGRAMGPWFLGMMAIHLVLNLVFWIPLWSKLCLKEEEKKKQGH